MRIGAQAYVEVTVSSQKHREPLWAIFVWWFNVKSIGCVSPHAVLEVGEL